MKIKIIGFLFLLIANTAFAQQNEDFKNTKGYFDYQRYLLNQSFKKKFDDTNDLREKIEIKKTFAEIMVKMDSLQNVEFINTLIKVKNKESLGIKYKMDNGQQNLQEGDAISQNEKPAEYPGGMNELRKQVAELLYYENTNSSSKLLHTEITFVVNKTGEITHVNAQGDNPSFNRQAEIALYLLPEKFSPAIINNQLVNYRFKMPLSMRLD